MFCRIALITSVMVTLTGCGPQRPEGKVAEETLAAPTAQVIEVGRPDQILRLQSSPAARSTVVKGGGYFPVIARLQNGEIAAVIRGGGAHMGRGGRLDLVFSSDDGETWSAPQTVVEGPDDDRNPALGVAEDGTLVLAYVITRGYGPDGKIQKALIDGVYVIRSTDHGKTWGAPSKIDNFPSQLVSPYGKIINIEDGGLLMHIYAEDDLLGFGAKEGRYYAYAFRSWDGGKTWDDISFISDGFGEIGFLQTKEKKILAAMRAVDRSEGGIHLSESTDNGKTWSRPLRVTFDSEHPADLIELADGRIIMTHGQRTRPMGVQALVSDDGGTTWKQKDKLALAWQAPNRDTGYPSSLVRRDGKILTLYYQVDNLDNAPESASLRALIWEPPPGW